jgi:hypothetical protein
VLQIKQVFPIGAKTVVRNWSNMGFVDNWDWFLNGLTTIFGVAVTCLSTA